MNMNKKTIITIMLALVTVAGVAQEIRFPTTLLTSAMRHPNHGFDLL